MGFTDRDLFEYDPNERDNDHPRNCGCRRCEPLEPDFRGRDRDEWRHEAAEQQRLK
jgi:hypothetical protein